MHNFVYLAQRRSQEFSCKPIFGGKRALRFPGCASGFKGFEVGDNSPGIFGPTCIHGSLISDELHSVFVFIKSLLKLTP